MTAPSRRPTPPRRLLHIAAREPSDRIWTRRFREELALYGELTIVGNGAALPEGEHLRLIRSSEVLLTGWGSANVPKDVAREPGRLEYVCNVTGSVRPFVPIEVVEAGIPVTNWGDAPAGRLAEGAMTLLLATLKDLHQQIECVRAGGWALDGRLYGGTLEGMSVGIYGLGVIGRRFVEMLRPFGAVMRFYDPYVTDCPDGLTRVDSLEAGSSLQKWQTGAFDVFVTGLSLRPDPMNYYMPFWHSASTTTGYNNPEYDRLNEEALAETDVERRTALYQQIEELRRSDVPWYPFMYNTETFAYSSRLVGYEPWSAGYFLLWNVDLP